jgi:hypothetical protein
VLDQNAEASADAVMTNGTRITGSWILPDQDGTVRIVAKYNEGDVAVQYRSHLRAQGREVRLEYNNVAVFPIFIFTAKNESSARYGPPSDNILDQLRLFVMSTEGYARPMMFEWIEKETTNYGVCTINMQRFVRE